MEIHKPGKHEQALKGAWQAGDKTPYGPLNPKRYRLQHVGDLALKLMEEHLDMEGLRVKATIAPGVMQKALYRHLQIAARMLDGDESSYDYIYVASVREELNTG